MSVAVPGGSGRITRTVRCGQGLAGACTATSPIASTRPRVRTNAMNSPRLMVLPCGGTPAYHIVKRKLCAVRHNKFEPLMTGLGQTRSCSDVRCTTALPPKAEVHPRSCYVASVPAADSCTAAKQHARADAPADFVLFVHGVAGLFHRLPSAIP